MHSYRASLPFSLFLLLGLVIFFAVPGCANAQQSQQRVVESVVVTGNRRLRQDDILYYVQTRPGDVYSPDQVERDYQAILSLNFFDKTQTRVLREDGARGGVNIIF